MPAKAGIQERLPNSLPDGDIAWIPAFAGMTERGGK